PVNALGLKYVSKLFARNERVVTVQGTRSGPVTTVMVGAIGVGRITMSFDGRFITNRGRLTPPVDFGDAGPFLAKGGELGRFHLGSTAIVLLGPGHDYRFMVDAGKHVRLGQAIVSRGSVPGAPSAGDS
ncbi:MAG TPA: phosphatidylserine decarboxylase, partial [Polyangiaceae bacterium]|nr:phosphatidylserine decarboxylase [Polyangiaceae bacterium]